MAGATGVAAISRFGAEEQSARIGLALAGSASRARMRMVWTAVVGLMAEALRLPRWSLDLSPYELVGRVPLESLDRDAWGLLALGAAVAVAASTVWFCSRSLERG